MPLTDPIGEPLIEKQESLIPGLAPTKPPLLPGIQTSKPLLYQASAESSESEQLNLNLIEPASEPASEFSRTETDAFIINKASDLNSISSANTSPLITNSTLRDTTNSEVDPLIGKLDSDLADPLTNPNRIASNNDTSDFNKPALNAPAIDSSISNSEFNKTTATTTAARDELPAENSTQLPAAAVAKSDQENSPKLPDVTAYTTSEKASDKTPLPATAETTSKPEEHQTSLSSGTTLFFESLPNKISPATASTSDNSGANTTSPATASAAENPELDRTSPVTTSTTDRSEPDRTSPVTTSTTDKSEPDRTSPPTASAAENSEPDRTSPATVSTIDKSEPNQTSPATVSTTDKSESNKTSVATASTPDKSEPNKTSPTEISTTKNLDTATNLEPNKTSTPEPDRTSTPPTNINFDSNAFTVDEKGIIGIQFTSDGGWYSGQLAIVSLLGMEKFVPGSLAFIFEAASRALSNSTKGYIAISDDLEGAYYTDPNCSENLNSGQYLGTKTFAMTPGDKFFFMLVPNDTVQQVYDNPAIGGDKKPLFSIATDNPSDSFSIGQIADITGEGKLFVMEDMGLIQGSDIDYDDITFRVTGATSKIVPLSQLVDPFSASIHSQLVQKLKGESDKSEPKFTAESTVTNSGDKSQGETPSITADNDQQKPQPTAATVANSDSQESPPTAATVANSDSQESPPTETSIVGKSDTEESQPTETSTVGKSDTQELQPTETSTFGKSDTEEAQPTATSTFGKSDSQESPPTETSTVGKSDSQESQQIEQTASPLETPSVSPNELNSEIERPVSAESIVSESADAELIKTDTTATNRIPKLPAQADYAVNNAASPPTAETLLIPTPIASQPPAKTSEIADNFGEELPRETDDNLSNAASQLPTKISEVIPAEKAVGTQENDRDVTEAAAEFETEQFPTTTAEIIATENVADLIEYDTTFPEITAEFETKQLVTKTESIVATPEADDTVERELPVAEITDEFASQQLLPKTDDFALAEFTADTIATDIAVTFTAAELETENSPAIVVNSLEPDPLISNSNSSVQTDFSIQTLFSTPSETAAGTALIASVETSVSPSTLKSPPSPNSNTYNSNSTPTETTVAQPTYSATEIAPKPADVSSGWQPLEVEEPAQFSDDIANSQSSSTQGAGNFQSNINPPRNLSITTTANLPIPGTFLVDNQGKVRFDYVFDGGSFEGELGIFSLAGMEAFTPGTPEFIAEAFRRVLSNSTDGHIVISDSTESAKFTGAMPFDGDWDSGEYQGIKTFNMTPGDTFAVMLVPNATVQSSLQSSYSGNWFPENRPLFSISTANPNDTSYVLPIADTTGTGNTFAMEDMSAANSDSDYNDLIFTVIGATGNAPPLSSVINPAKEWRNTPLGQELIEYANSLIPPSLPNDDIIRLVEGEIFANTYERTLTIPTSGSFLNISLANLNFDTSDTKSIKDAFEIALVDNSGKSLVHTISPGKNAFFNSTEGQQSQLASGVTFNGSNISVNLSQIAPGTTATLQIRLVNNDSDKTTQVGITSIAIQPASAATAPVTALPFQDVSPNAPVNFARLQDVSSRLGAEYKQTSFNSSSKILYADLAVKNTGQYPVRGTLLVAINKISDPTVRLLDADGITPEGIPYYDISKLVGGGILEPGELTSTDTLKFYNPQGVQFSYDLVFLSQLNQVPQFKATPNTEALVGKSYVYTAIAVDADGDALTYSLLEKPLGMEIDAQTGIISWNPVAGDIGNHAVTVQVEDGKGGIAKQKYVLSAINAPPNRPPIFTSTPVVDAWLKQPYRYQVQGKDDDGDTLTFNLVNAPSNMTLDPRTGLLTWTPSGNQRNAANVMLRAVDGLSGIAEQSFSILTQQQPGNNAPLIVSEPATQGYAGSAYSYSVRALDSDSDPLRYSLVGAPAGVVVDENTGVLTWNAPVVGSHNVAVRARDSRGGESTQSWSVNISNNQPGELRGTVMSGNRFSEIEVSVKATLTADNRYALYYGADDGASLKLVGIDTQNNWYGAETFNFTMPSDEHLYVVAWDEGSTQMLLAELSDNISLRTNTQDWEYIVSTNRSPSWPNVPPIAQLRDEISRSTWQIPQESAPNGSFPWGSFVSQGISQTARYIWHDSIYSNSSSDGFYAIFRSIDPVGARLRQPGAVVYIDANNNNRLDEGESSTTTDANGNYLFTLAPGTYTVATLLPPGSTQIVPSSETYQVSLASGQVLAGLDFRSAIGTRTFGNQNPVFTSTAPTTASAGQLVRYRPTATDADKNPLVYDLIVKPEGMAIDPQTGTVGWIPTAQQWGAHDFTIRVQDGYGGLDLQSSTITVKPGNERPHFTTIVGLNVTAPTGTVGQPLQIQFKAIDADFDPISYSLGTAPADAVIGTNTGIFTWTPTVSGSRTITVIARDGKGEETAQTFNLNVIASAPNTDPTITSTPRLYTGLGQAYFYNLQANDPYGDPLTYTLETAPAGMRIDSQGRVTWQPTTAFFGSNPVKISVEDGRGGVAEQEFILNVGSQNQNQPPSITSIPRQTATVQKLYQYDIAATDPDKDPLFWSLDAAPVGMSIDPETGKLRWNPSPDQIGTHDVALRVMDISGTYVGQAFTLNVRGVNVPPGIISTPPTLAAANKTYNYAVLARDAENDPLTFSLVSPPNGMTINPKTGLIQWTPSLSQVGVQNVGVLVSDSSEATASQQYALTISQTAINLPPAITSTPVFTASPGRPYSYQVTAADADGTISQYQLLQSPPGMTINSATGSITWNNPTAGNHQVVVGAVDNSGTGAAQGFELIARANSAAVVPTIPIQSVSPGASYRYDLKATDANGDLLTFALIQSPSGMTVDEFGRISWKPNAANIGNHPVEVKVTDTFGESVTVSYNLSVVADTSAPKVNIVASKNTANLGDSVTFTVNAVDNVKVESLGLTINGTPVVLDAQGQANVKVNNLGNFTAVATAKDAAGNVGNATQTVAAIDTSDVNAPTINISLEDDAEITAPFNITGTISDSNLAYYTLEVAPVGGGQIPGDGGGFKEVYRGTAAVSNGTVATFDPTVLANGAYVLKFTAIDTNGNGSTTERTVNVAGDLKLGNFRLSFTDLSVPVAGIPINVTRTYDSLNANASDDFGYGWRMEFRDTDLKTSLKADPTYEELGINTVPFDSKTKVFITLPGGKRETFTFKPTPHHLNQYLGGAGPGAQMFKPAFESHSGSTMTLTVKDANLVRNENGYYGVNAQPFNPENPAFGGVYVLTTKEGLIYEIDAKTGDLLTATDANGNKLTFSDAGIKSSTGKSVTFERDVVGRIVSVVDPDGKKVKYEYDAKGDLVAVKDRENNTTSFKYEAANNPHFLTEVVDALGRSGVKTGYDDSGRLKQMVDANGSAVELVYDASNSLQKVKDVFGKETTYVYDSRGNVVQKVNVLGGITQQTFDENNKLLTQTDPLGNTTTYAYDSGGNLIYITDPLGNKAYYSYNSFGQVTSRTDPLGNTISYTYDKRRNLLNTTNAEGNTIRETTNQFGNTTSLTDANGNKTRFEYDDFGNVIRQIDAFGNETAYTYNSNGDQITETVKVTTLNGLRQQTTSWTYDSQGRVQTKTNSTGNVIRHEYDILGNLTAVIEEGAIARRTEYRYNAKNQLVETLYADGTSEKSVYDEAGRLIAETDRTNQTTRYIYDALGRLIETIYPDSTPGNLADNPRTKSEYDKAGRITASTDERGNRTEYEYDKAGRRTLVRDALRRETTYTYDAMGNLLTETDALGRTTRYAYDKVGRRTETYLADRTGAITKYNKAGLKVAETNQAGQTTNFVYDALDRLVEVIHPDSTPNDLSNNPRTKTEYNELGWVIASIDELGNRTEYEYDAVGRIIESRSSCACRRKTYTYDEFGNRITETDQLGRTNRFVYDELGRIKQTYFDDNTYTTNVYDDLGRIISTTDQAGKKTAFEYDVRGQLVAVVDALQQRTEYGYDFSGNLTSIKDANNNITRYEYDKLGRRIAVILPKEQRSEITYDAVGNVLSAKDLNGKTVTYEYDKLNRLAAEKFPDGTSLKYTYTSTGQRQTATETKGGIVRTTTYEYDERDRLVSRTEPDGRKVEYTYDQVGNIAAVKTPSGTAINTYDKYNQLKTVTDPDGGLTEYIYDKAGNLIRTQLPNGTVEIREYDKLNRLTFTKNFRVDPVSGQEVVISSYRYTLNAAGQRTKVEENSGRIVEYSYDDLYRLIEEKIVDFVAGDRTIQYGYDEIGNRVTRNDSIQGLTTYTYDENDRLLNETLNGQVTTYAYDNNGNLLSRFKNNTDKAVNTWDFENRLIGAQVTDASGTRNIEYRYDADGVRVATIVNGQETRYLIDANQSHAQVLEEYSPNGNLQASYVYGLDLVSTERGSDRVFYHVDGLGSTRALTNGAGNAIDTYTYDAYGNLIGKTGNTVNNYLYAGEQYDPNLGDYYLRARYYDTETGRFGARDPFEGVLTEPLSLAKYSYVHGNPVNATDPSGLFLQEQSSVMSILTILTTMTYIMGRSPIGTLSTLDGDNALVPGYLKNTSHTGVNKFLNTAITGKYYQIIRKKVQECNTTVGAGNCDLEGFPIIVWGHEIPEITQHTQEAIVQTGQSFLARISPGWNNTPTGRVKKYSNGAEYPAPWYDFTPECPWDNDNPMRYFNSRSGRDCDEYPYNSTLQGGPLNYDAGKVSLKLVNSQQNKTQGVFLGGEFDKNTRGFYQYAPVLPNHPKDSWFGVQVTHDQTHWIDKEGNERDINTGDPWFPF